MEFKEIIKILKKGGIGVILTDTIYGLVGSAFSKKAVERIYKVRKRERNKPFIVLISSLRDLKKFGVRPNRQTLNLLKKIWPGSVSVILPCPSKKFFYLHRGAPLAGGSLAFRLPKPQWLRKILKQTGPLVAPSANLAGKPPAQTIAQAKRYFGDKIDFYFDRGKRKGQPSNIVELKR